jgi:carboxypeptidase Taq
VTALERLKDRVGQIQDLGGVARLLSWDQQTMMPPAGAGHRAEQQATIRRLAHELLVDGETGRLLDELASLEGELDPDSDDAALIRVVRRDYEKEVRVPTELRVEMARAAAEGREVWVRARADSDYESFRPALERNVELRRRYVECFDGVAEPYDVLLDDFEPATTAAEVRQVFAPIRERVPALVARIRDGGGGDDVDDGAFLRGDFPIERQAELGRELVELLGYRAGTWRLDPTEHPFASSTGVDDVRITTHYDARNLEFILAVVHEFGHGLYEQQVPRELGRLPTGRHCSLGLHESQSRLWENQVGRNLGFWRLFYPRLQQAFPQQLGAVDVERFHRALNRVQPSPIRIHADEVTYGLHIVLRFELEQELLAGTVDTRELPQVWNERMHAYLGIEIRDDAEGVLQDTHWASGLIGYFPTYLLGSVMSVQIWEAARRDLPELDEQVARADFAPLREWLGEHVHRHARKFSPQETLRRATGSTIDARPYLEHLERTYG